MENKSSDSGKKDSKATTPTTKSDGKNQTQSKTTMKIQYLKNSREIDSEKRLKE